MDAAMNSAVSALQAQQAALSTVSDNLANSQTSGYKAVTTQFNSLLTQEATGLGYPAGGVSATARQNLLAQGLVQSTNTTTDMAITGSGMFAVSAGLGGANDFYTRNGAFDSDSKGDLQLSGTNYYLLGWATDAKGNVLGANPDNIASLQNVNINKFNNSATATTLYSLQANLPAEAQSAAYTQTYISGATPPTTENLSFGVSKLSTNSSGDTIYQLTVTGSDPAANIVDTTSGAQSNSTNTVGAGQPLVYQVTVDSSGNVVQTVDPLGNVTTGSATAPVALPSFSIQGNDPSGSPAFGAITSSDNGFATNGSGGPIELTSSFAGLGTPFSQNTSISVYDSLGVAQSFPVTWTAEGNNQWLMTVNNPTNPAGTAQTGQLYDTAGNPVNSYSYNVTFNSDGTLNSIVGLSTATQLAATAAANGTTPPAAGAAPVNGNEPVLSATWFDGAQSSLTGTSDQINVNLGTAGALGSGKTDGLSQFDTGESTPSIAVKSTTQNGVQYGNLTGVSIDGSTGDVIAAYSNGQKVPIYKIPVVTFPNENGLSAQNDGVYQQSSLSGTYTLNAAGTNGAGTIQGQTLEQSNVNTSTEFSNMITAQQAYSAASQVIGTDKQMFTSLIQVVQ
jgi:flagellar hook protein FlgE